VFRTKAEHFSKLTEAGKSESQKDFFYSLLTLVFSLTQYLRLAPACRQAGTLTFNPPSFDKLRTGLGGGCISSVFKKEISFLIHC
jgi:hypothetical protein